MNSRYYLTNAITSYFTRTIRARFRGRKARMLRVGGVQVAPGRTIRLSPETVEKRYAELEAQAPGGAVHLVYADGNERILVDVAKTGLYELPHLKEDKPEKPVKKKAEKKKAPEPKLKTSIESSDYTDLLDEPKPEQPEKKAPSEPEAPFPVEPDPGTEPEEPEESESETDLEDGIPSKSDLHEANKGQLVEWADKYGVNPETGSLKEDYKKALLEHFYPDDYDY